MINARNTFAIAFLILAVICIYLIYIQISGYKTAHIRHYDGSKQQIDIVLARSQSAKTLGLSNRSKLCSDCGMLFIYYKPSILSFWMQDTYIPLDIAFLDKNLRIQEIVRNMQPMSEEVISSRHLSQYALEVNSGYFDQHQIKIGDRLFY